MSDVPEVLADLRKRREYDGPGLKMASDSEEASALRGSVEGAPVSNPVSETPSSAHARAVSQSGKVETGNVGFSKLRLDFQRKGLAQMRELAGRSVCASSDRIHKRVVSRYRLASRVALSNLLRRI